MSGPKLEAVGLTKAFGALVAVDDVSFAVGRGEVVGLLGANGAGKTTTIRMLLGLLAPDRGRAALLGSAPSRGNRRRLGYVPQGLGLYRDLTVAQNVAFSAGAYQASAAALDGPLAEVTATLVRDLPLGLQRRLAFFCALQHEPSVLVLDEPTSGVEALASTRLWDTIRAQAESGAAALVTTHSMQEARQCDRLLLMSQGCLVGQGSEADIVAGTPVLAVRSDSWERSFAVLSAADYAVTLDGRAVRVIGADAARLRHLLSEHGVAAEVEPVTATIEERMTQLVRQQ